MRDVSGFGGWRGGGGGADHLGFRLFICVFVVDPAETSAISKRYTELSFVP